MYGVQPYRTEPSREDRQQIIGGGGWRGEVLKVEGEKGDCVCVCGLDCRICECAD